MTDQPILIIGTTGKTGSRVAAKLEAKGVSVRLGARRSQTPFDWEDPDTWAPILSGVARAYVTYFPELAFPGAVEKPEAFTKVALETGLQQIVLLSGGDIAEPIIDFEDIAEVVVAALTEEGHLGESYEVTGPRLMTFAEMAEVLSTALSRPIQHIPIAFEDFYTNVAASGGDFVAGVFTKMARETQDGRNAYVVDGVERALGRKPRDFADFAVSTTAIGAYSDAA